MNVLKATLNAARYLFLKHIASYVLMAVAWVLLAHIDWRISCVSILILVAIYLGK